MTPDPAYWAGRAVCVTGGTGFLGYHLVKLLTELNARVRVFALDPPPDHPVGRFPNTEIVSGNILDAAAVRSAASGCSVVIHTAGIVAVTGPAVRQTWPVHVDGTRSVLSALDPGARLVHTSSVVAIGASTSGEVLDEDSPFNLGHTKVEYVRAKRAAEELALGSAADVVVVNPGYLLGPDDYDWSVMGQFCRRFWRGRAPVAPPGGLCLVDVRDVAAGHLLAAERGQRGRRYILGSENLSYRALLRTMSEVAGFRPRAILPVPWPLFAGVAVGNEVRGLLFGKKPWPAVAHARMNRYFWYYSSDRARRELGYAPRPVRDSLADAYAWHMQRKAIPVHGLKRWLLRPAGH